MWLLLFCAFPRLSPQDPNIIRNGRMDMLELKEFREFKKIILLGYRFAQRLHEQGEFERFNVADVAKLKV